MEVGKLWFGRIFVSSIQIIFPVIITSNNPVTASEEV